LLFLKFNTLNHENLMKVDVKALEDKLKDIGAPYTPGRIMEEQ